jgi:hypothetical protein
MSPFPRLAQVVLDTTDARRLAEFYREFLGFHYGQPPATSGTYLCAFRSAGYTARSCSMAANRCSGSARSMPLTSVSRRSR